MVHVLDPGDDTLKPAIVTRLFTSRFGSGSFCAHVKYFANVTQAFERPYNSSSLHIYRARGIADGDGVVSLDEHVKGKFVCVHSELTLPADPLQHIDSMGSQLVQQWTLILLRHCIST